MEKTKINKKGPGLVNFLEENKSSGDILSREMEDLNLNGLYFDEFQKMRVMVS